MRVKVKLVVFRHPEPAKWGVFCSYCPAIKEFQGRGKTIEDVVNIVTRILEIRLSKGCMTRSLRNFGWSIMENSLIPPIFTDEELLRLTEGHYGLRVTDYQIIELNGEVTHRR
ncbi:hypothetical protein [Alistipes sp.]|uniref:hypothetical protein n=1 Tax=Alistipes sp. TaxID=1872444 RepID=UPI002877F8BC|nr:hypothetical protein [Alistipes sp.]